MTTLQIGAEVLNVRSGKRGTVLEIHEGCNTTLLVQFDGVEFSSIQAIQDIALVGTYPCSRF